MSDTTGGNTVDAQRAICQHFVDRHCSIDNYGIPRVHKLPPLQLAWEALIALEAAGFRVVPADLLTNARSASVCEDPPYGERCDNCYPCRLAASLAAYDGDDPLGVFAGNP